MNKFGKERERSQKGSGSLRQINGTLRMMQSFFPIQKVEQGLGLVAVKVSSLKEMRSFRMKMLSFCQ